MRIKTTAVLFAIVVVLGVMIGWVDRNPVSSEGAGNVLVRIEPEKIGRITVKRPTGSVVLEKRDETWFVAAPIEDRADPEAVNALLDTLGYLALLDDIDEGEIGSAEDLSLSALGLTSDQVIEVEIGEGDKGKNPQSLLVGNPTPLANSIYARLPGSDTVAVVQGNPRKFLEDPVTALRDRNLIRKPTDQVVRVVIKTPLGEIDIRRKITPVTYDWTLFKPLQTRANREMLEAMLAGLGSLRFSNVTDTGNVPGPIPTPIPDGSAALQLYSFGDEEPLTILLRPGDPVPAGQMPNLEATVSDRTAVFEVNTNLLADLPDSPDAFRDRNLARVPPQAVFGIGIQSRGHAPVILKTGKTRDGSVRWFSVRNENEELANQARILGLINAINQTQILDFVSDSAARLDEFNLDPPAQKIAISLYEIQPETAPDGAPAPDAGDLGIAKKVLQLGSSDDGSALFANFEGEPYIYEIGPEFLQKFYGDPLRWKSLRVLTFSAINLGQIRRKTPGEPELVLDYDHRFDSWEAQLGDEDVKDRLDRVRAAQLREALGSLTAVDWTTSPDVFQALQDPVITFTVVIREYDRAIGKSKDVTHTIRFAPRAPGTGIFYGQMDNSADLFQLDRETFTDLIAPLLVRKAPADRP